jgi:hypothetical protein
MMPKQAARRGSRGFRVGLWRCRSCRASTSAVIVHPRCPGGPGIWEMSGYILKGLDPVAVEAVFRRHAALLQAARATPGQDSIALDGKTLRGSFDNFHERAAAQVLSAFATDTALVLAHVDTADKSNEIPAASDSAAAPSASPPRGPQCQEQLGFGCSHFLATGWPSAAACSNHGRAAAQSLATPWPRA